MIVKQRGPVMAKRGTAFEQVVADVIRAVDPLATVRQGEWINGPDGRRDRDVLIEGHVNGRPYNVLVECKDYDPKRTGPVGINPVDALESKRRDLNVDLAIICSNAGFTSPAMKKSKRVGIVLIGVFRQGDGRIRHQVCDEVYFRRLKIEYLGFRLEHSENGEIKNCTDASATFLNEPVANWVCHHARQLIATNPIGGGHYAGLLAFKKREQFETSQGAFSATHIFVEFILSGGWYSQMASIDGSNGLYDVIRKRAFVGMKAYEFHLKDMDLTAGTPIEFPPNAALDLSRGTKPGEVALSLSYVIDANCHEPVPPLDKLIVESDLDPKIVGLPVELQPTGAINPNIRTVYSFALNPKVGPNQSFTLTGHSPTIKPI